MDPEDQPDIPKVGDLAWHINGLDPREVTRVEQDENGQTQIGLVAGEPQGDDQVIQHDGQDLLHIAAPVSEALDGASIEKVETDEGVGFSINPPEEEPQV